MELQLFHFQNGLFLKRCNLIFVSWFFHLLSEITKSNLTTCARIKGIETIVRKRIENENWKMARMFIEHFKMKNGYMNYTHVSQELNLNGYKTRYGNEFTPASVRRLFIQKQTPQ